MLQQLRDIHEPVAPYWFAPTPAWWVVACLAAVLLMVLVRVLWQRKRLYQPYWTIRRAARKENNSFLIKHLTDQEYTNNINILYKYLLITVEGRREAVPAFGSVWQEMLQDRFDEPDFVTGAGRDLGTIRFMRVKHYDGRLSDLVQRTLCVVRPPKKAERSTK